MDITLTEIVACVGGFTGIAGTVLGIINAVRQGQMYKVRLRVVPKLSIIVRDKGGNEVVLSRTHGTPFPVDRAVALCIEVVNLSVFPVTISEVGLGIPGRKGRQFLYCPRTSTGQPLPVRLEPRAAISALASPKAEIDFSLIRKPVAYAETECGHIFYGTSLAFRRHWQSCRKQTRGEHASGD